MIGTNGHGIAAKNPRTSATPDEIPWSGRNRKQRKCNVLEASKAPEHENRVVGRSGPELVHMTKAGIKEGKPLKRGPCRKGFRELNRIWKNI